MNRKFKTVLIDILFVIVCVVLAYGVSNYLFFTIPVSGPSMNNTLYDGDKLLVYKRGEYRFGDVVIFNTHKTDGNGNERYYVKRIIGLPGDTIEIRREADGVFYVYRNGEKLIEPYLHPENLMNEERAPVTVPEGKFYYLGDNRGESSDSRNGELGSTDSILGRVLLRYRIGNGEFDIEAIKRIKS